MPSMTEIAPIPQARCVICHSAGRLRPPLGLKLDSLEGMLEGSQNGPIVRANDPDGSELIKRLKGIHQPRMPMIGDSLTEAEIALFEQWIANGLQAE